MFNDRIERLETYPFQRLNDLLASVAPPDPDRTVLLSIGEPQNGPPSWVADLLHEHRRAWSKYPPPNATPAFRQAVADWLTERFALPADMIDPDRHVCPCPGTREALFMTAQIVVPRRKNGRQPTVLMPNPMYHVYSGASLMAGADTVLLDCTAETGHLPDLDAIDPDLLDRCALFYICSPSNPQGVFADESYLARLIGLARHHDFVVAADECYSEIYDDAPPVGALQVAATLGGDGPADATDRVVVLHSLSKRSSAPGMRSGFVAGDPRIVAGYRSLIGFAGAPTPLPIVEAATALWRDEAHVEANRALYRANFDAAARALGDRYGFHRPGGGFFAWLDVGDGEAAARRIWAEAGIKTMPGAYMARTRPDGSNPGRPYLRLALVYGPDIVGPALDRISEVLG